MNYRYVRDAHPSTKDLLRAHTVQVGSEAYALCALRHARRCRQPRRSNARNGTETENVHRVLLTRCGRGSRIKRYWRNPVSYRNPFFGVSRPGFAHFFPRLLTRGVPYLSRKPISAKIKLHPDDESHGPGYTETSFFRNKIGTPTVFA